MRRLNGVEQHTNRALDTANVAVWRAGKSAANAFIQG